MKDTLISYETAVIAKDKGFDIPITQSGQVYCTELKEIMTIVDSNAVRNWNDSKFTNICSAPTQSLLQRWLREIHNIIVSVDIQDDRTYFISLTAISPNSTGDNIWGNYKTYEEALENGLKEALELIKK